MYPSGDATFSFKMYIGYPLPIQLPIKIDQVESVVLEKENPSDIFDPKWKLTLQFGPVESIAKVDELAAKVVFPLLDKLAFALDTRIFDIALTGHGLSPKPGEGGNFHIILPMLFVIGTVRCGVKSLTKDDISLVAKDLDGATHKDNILLRLYHYALNIDNPTLQFMVLYMLVYEIFGNQKKIDEFIKGKFPTPLLSYTDQSGKTRPTETTYTRLRNQLTHRPDVDIKATEDEILGIIDQFRHIVREAIKSL